MASQAVDDIVISAFGILSPLGVNTEQTCTSIRAGIAAFSEYPYYTCISDDQHPDEESVCYAARAPDVGPNLNGVERLLQLATPALTELIHKTNFNAQDAIKSGLFVALPQNDDVVKPWQLDLEFIPQLCKRLSCADFKEYKVNQEGRSSVFSLIGDAIKRLQSNQLDYCIVGGVDSWLFEQRLPLLDAAWRIKSVRNVDGFIPGEAAVMMMLETATQAKARGVLASSCIHSVSFGNEPETIYSDKVCTGKGLGEALDSVLKTKTADHVFESVYCDLNGESYSAYEWGLTQTRMGVNFGRVKMLVHPAENCGDVGAASGGLLLACASHALQRGYNRGDEALLWTASDAGKRAALTIRQA